MDFLKSPMTEPRRVVLLLIVANQGTSRLLLYRWDSWQALTTTKPLKSSGYALPMEDAFPHLLIPSCKLLSFAIVTGHKLVFYDDITSKKKTKRVFNIPTPDDQKDKQWVQWAKAVRHEEHRKQKEDIFLIREDGLLKTTIVTHNSVQRANITFEPGHLHIRVDTAICALSAPPTKGGDILIACGDTTEGGVFHLMARMPPVNVQSLANWSPIRDVVHIIDKSGTPGPGDQIRILAATGMHENRAFLTEVHYGLEAQIVEAIEFEDAATVDRLWVLHQASEARQLLLISHHEHSNIICHEMASGSLSVRGPELFPQLGFDSPTLAACNIERDVLLQITTSQIHLLGLFDQSHPDPQSLRGDFFCADIHASTGTFVVAAREGPKLSLVAGIVVGKPDKSIDVLPLSQSQPIDYVPVSLSLADLAGNVVLVSGSQDGRLHLYKLNMEHGITGYAVWDLSSFDGRLYEPKISSVAVMSLPKARDGLVICGMRTGQLMVFELTLQATGGDNQALLRLGHFQGIGTTAVSIKTELNILTEDERSAFVTCGSALLQLHLHRNACGLDFTIDSLLVSALHQDQDHHLASIFNAVARIERTSSGFDGPICGLLAGITENALLLLRLGQNALIPKRIVQIQPTRHLVHSAHLQKCVASVTRKRPLHSPDSGRNLDERPVLQIMDSEMPGLYDEQKEISHICFGEKGEKIRALLRWAPTNGDTHYEMIVIGSDHNGDGKLSYITAKRLSQAKAGASATTFITYAKKSISAMCEYGLSSLLVCAGRELKLVHLDLSTKPPRWEHQAEIELPSRATELRTKGSVVYVATSLHSFMLIREQDKKFQVIGSDSWAGKARNVLPYGESSTLVNLVSDHGSRILDFAGGPSRGTRPVFEATVPEAIDKLIHLKMPTSKDARERFLGTTIDGTVYIFTTLNEHEMKLLAFLEQLCQPTRDQAAKNASALAHRIVHQYANKLESVGIATPTFGSTHARGDMLKALLASGPYNIYFLLRKRVKSENMPYIKEEDESENLRDVAEPVLGQTENVVEAVVMWLRELLNVPTF